MGDTEMDAGHHDMPHDVHADAHHDVHDQESSLFFKLLGFRSLVAALTFFGLGGGLAQSAGAPDILTFGFAVTLGALAMVGVAWIFNLLMRLREEGNVHIENALGAHAVVYLTIPEKRQGMGKVTVTIQDRSMECNAVTSGDRLPTGRTVTITDIIDATTVEVAEQH
jgi:hypothetical protein